MFNKFFTRNNIQDDEAFRVIFEMFYDRVYQTAYYITKDRYLAQDVLQDTFLKAFRNMKDVQDGTKTGAWLSVIATHTAIDLLRKRNRWNGIPTDDVILLNMINPSHEAVHSTELELEKSFHKEQVNRQIMKLKPDYRQVILLKYHHGLKDAEIANMLGMSVGTIKSRIHRAKIQIKSLLLLDDQDGSERVGDIH